MSAKEGACAAVDKVKPDLSWISKEIGTADDFARTHRELVVAGVGLAVAVPSLIGAFLSLFLSSMWGSVETHLHNHTDDTTQQGGPRRAVVNGVVAAGVTAGVFGFSEWWGRRQKEAAGGK